MEQPESSPEDEIRLDDHTMLTASSPLSSLGLPVLRLNTGREVVDLRPTDRIGDELAADYVIHWARQPDRTDADRHAANQFLRQWPTGPQL